MDDFSIRNDRPILIKGFVKTVRKQGNHSKAVSDFMNNNIVTVKIDSSGKPNIIIKSI